MHSILREITKTILRFYLRLFHRVKYYGLENIPPAGGAILASNHPTYMDPVVIRVGVRRRICWMAWDALFRVPVLGWMIRNMSAYPVDPDRADRSAYRQTLELLRRGEIVGVFPEGGRSYQPLMGLPRSGAVRLAARAGVPVIPVSIAGAFRVWPRYRLLPRPGRIAVTIHKPLAFDGVRVDKETEVDLLERVRDIINRSLVQTYIEWQSRRIYDPLPCELMWRGPAGGRSD